MTSLLTRSEKKYHYKKTWPFRKVKAVSSPVFPLKESESKNLLKFYMNDAFRQLVRILL